MSSERRPDGELKSPTSRGWEIERSCHQVVADVADRTECRVSYRPPGALQQLGLVFVHLFFAGLSGTDGLDIGPKGDSGTAASSTA